ncbi:competence protein ComEC [Streptococcus criceti]|uniref:Membrane protein n=1 Tax=Streptococcus criceti HS-6 TaxID=873449 RepID=G5JT56_STRCG|nr:DNA internalization-related competence protein ComEC/Rec2 [Streptococcus criceti]EHI74881.1 putative membrane protein [Streptococcus criceti HS-6]SUN37602.1 competence protein ComEC [Streptococcus criceti]
MTKYAPIKPIYLAFLLVLLTYFIYSYYWLVGVILTFTLFQLWRHHGLKIGIQVSLILLVFGLVFSAYQAKGNDDDRSTPSQLQELRMIPDTISVNGDQLSFRARSQGRTYQVFYRLKTPEEKQFYQNVTVELDVMVSAKLIRAQPQRNFHGFNYRVYLKHERIYRLVAIDKIKSLEPAKRLSLLDRLHILRRQALVNCQQNFPSPMNHYMTGLLFGYLGKDFSEMRDIYTGLGIIHLFALSGMQVDFFIGFYRKFLLRLGVRRDWVDILQVPFSIFYAGMTGYAPSVLRSLLQSFWRNLGLQRLDNLAFSVFSMFLLRPNFLLTTGGLLSFVYAFILAVVDFKGLSRRTAALAKGVSLALGAFPILAYLFGVFQPLSIVLTFIFSLIFDYLILPFLSLAFLLTPLLKLTWANPVFILLEKTVVWTHNFIGRSPVCGSPSLAILLTMLVLLAFLYDYWMHKKIRCLLIVLFLILVCLVKHPLTNEVTVLDIGQGDSIFLRDSWGKTILIDTGGRVTFGQEEAWQKGNEDSNADRTVVPYLKSRGVGKIDQLVLTHTDTDHIGDLETVARHFKIGEVLVSRGSLTRPSFVRRLKTLKVKVRTVEAGDNLAIMGSWLHVLYPKTIGDGGNNDSLVLYGHLLNKNFLFTGDLEKEGEEDLLRTYPDLRVDILKAGHHGSKGSSSPDFLMGIKPETALISAGKNNRYGHPNKETLERFRAQNMAVYRTDQVGAISYRGLWEWHLETVR